MFIVDREKDNLQKIDICNTNKEHIYHSNGIDFVILYTQDKEVYCVDEDHHKDIFTLPTWSIVRVLKKISKDEYEHITRFSKELKC